MLREQVDTMLNTMRKHASGWVVKILLAVLILSFAVWGIGDMFLGGTGSDAVKVAGKSVNIQDISRELDRNVNQLRQQIDPALDQQTAIRLGALHQAVQAVATRETLAQFTDELGITLDDETLRQKITEDPLFGGIGGFDRQQFNNILYSGGFTEATYLASFNRDESRAALIDAMAANLTTPPVLTRLLQSYEQEKRSGRMIVIPRPDVATIAEPDEATIATFYDDDKSPYTIPEYRSGIYITITAEDLASEMIIDESRVQSLYDERIAQFTTPETRTVDQVIVPDADIAAQVQALAVEEGSLAIAAEQFADQSVTFSTLEAVDRNGLIGNLAETVFGLDVDDVSDPVESPFGQHVFVVTEISPETISPFDEVKDALSDELALDDALRGIHDLSTRLDDELAAGLTLRDAAAAVGIETVAFGPVDQSGRLRDAPDETAADPQAEWLQTAFTLAVEEPPFVNEDRDGGYHAVWIDSIEAAGFKPLEEVRGDVITAWQLQQIEDQMQEQATAMIERLNDGESLESVAGELEVIALTDLAPQDVDPGKQIMPTVIDRLFSTPAGVAASQTASIPEGMGIVATDNIVSTATDEAEASSSEIGEVIRSEMTTEMLTQLRVRLAQDYPVEADMETLTRLYDPNQQGYGDHGGM